MNTLQVYLHYSLCFKCIIVYVSIACFIMFELSACLGRDAYFNNEDKAKVSIVNLCEIPRMAFIQNRHKFTTLTSASAFFDCRCHYRHVSS